MELLLHAVLLLAIIAEFVVLSRMRRSHARETADYESTIKTLKAQLHKVNNQLKDVQPKSVVDTPKIRPGVEANYTTEFYFGEEYPIKK